jgi:hypothetical protein
VVQYTTELEETSKLMRTIQESIAIILQPHLEPFLYIQFFGDVSTWQHKDAHGLVVFIQQMLHVLFQIAFKWNS